MVLGPMADKVSPQCKPGSVIHPSDQGSQDTSVAFGLRCTERGVRSSMGSVGDCCDNAMCENFFSLLECELMDLRKFKTKARARVACFEFIEGWYTPSRRHSALGYKSPNNYEKTAAKELEALSPELSTKRLELQLPFEPLFYSGNPRQIAQITMIYRCTLLGL